VNHDLLGGIDYKKGCFVGQEVASRMHRKGGVRKRTIRVDADPAALDKGAELKAGDTPLGTVTSARDGDALALVRTDRIAKAPNLRLAVTAGIGSDHVDLDAAIAHGVTVAEVTYCNSISVSEHIVMMILAPSLVRRGAGLPVGDERLKHGIAADDLSQVRRALAEALGISTERVSVKASRPEGLMLAGDGAACLALAVLALSP
jgi:hypothetical protein